MKGYRCDNIFGDGETDPQKVVLYETGELGNTDILEWILDHPRNLKKSERQFLKRILSKDTVAYEDDIQSLREIVKKYCEGRNYCRWLCDTPKDVYDSYMAMCPEMHQLPYQQALDKGILGMNEITVYEVPDDAIIMSDLGGEGKLYCWKR